MADTTGNKKVNPVVVGLAGAVAGAALGAVAAKVLSEEKNRKMIKKRMSDFKSWTDKTMKDLRKKGETVQEDVEEFADEMKEKIEEVKVKADKTPPQFN